MKIIRIDHLVLTVLDIDKTIHFYTQVLGMEVLVFEGNRKALKFGNQKINLHQKGCEFEPKAGKPSCGSADLCFIVDENIEDVLRELLEKKVKIIGKIVARTGAMGSMKSVYFRDPDCNLIEVSNYV